MAREEPSGSTNARSGSSISAVKVIQPPLIQIATSLHSHLSSRHPLPGALS